KKTEVLKTRMCFLLIFQNLVCCASDVLEGGRGVVRVAVTVSELLRFHQTRSPLQTSSSMPNHVPA
ncbi:hypothetical protein ALC57_18821, partial [Trachymyrmex cornetzi]